MTPARPDLPAQDLSARVITCLTPRRLHLILMPTEACNFRCVYCYESFALKRMKPEVVAGVKALLARRAPGLRSLVLSWFGGEPLLAPDVIEDVMEHARVLQDMHPELSVSSDVTTNASLLDSTMATRLMRAGVRDFQISFDGPRAHHDQRRVRPGGLPTFDRIWTNLVALAERPDRFHVTIRLHIDNENVDSIPDFLRPLAGLIAGDGRFELFIRPVARLGGPRDADLPVLSKEDSAPVLERLRGEAFRLGIKLAKANSGDPICYAAQANSFLVRADGRLNKCTVALDHPANEVGRILEDGTLDLRRNQMFAWMRGLSTGEPEALACPMKGITVEAEMAGAATEPAVSRYSSEANTAR